MLEVASSLKSDCYDIGTVGALRGKLQASFHLSFIIKPSLKAELSVLSGKTLRILLKTALKAA